LEAAINFEINRQTVMLANGQRPIQETRGYNALTSKTFPQRTKEDAADYRYFPDPDLPPIEFTPEQIAVIRTQIEELPAAKTARFIKEYNLNERSASSLTLNKQKSKFFEEILQLAKKDKLNCQKLVNDLLNKKLIFSFDEPASEIISKFKTLSTNDLVDEKELQIAIDQVLEANQDAVKKYKAGKTVVIGFLVGQVIKQLGKKADITMVKQQLINSLD
jgi:aspartyl-tRNA(Asn)/glutamyl-tRNA(Gln) amidotransferase subunit B